MDRELSRGVSEETLGKTAAVGAESNTAEWEKAGEDNSALTVDKSEHTGAEKAGRKGQTCDGGKSSDKEEAAAAAALSHKDLEDKAEDAVTKVTETEVTEVKADLANDDEVKDGDAKDAEAKVNEAKDDEVMDDEARNIKERTVSLQISGYIQVEEPSLRWDDIAGLKDAKNSLIERVLLPVKFPQLFSGARRLIQGILLFGAPGSGKSRLVRAAAAESGISHLLIMSCYSLVSRRCVQGDKLLQTLFETARAHRPSLILLDDLDALCQSQDQEGLENQAVEARRRRAKTELLVQIEKVNRDPQQAGGVMILASSSVPWRLEAPVRHRFPKRIYLGLPDAAERSEMFRMHMGDNPHTLTEEDFRELGMRSEGFSPADIVTVVGDGLFAPLRKVQSATHYKKVPGPSPSDPSQVVQDLWTPCSPGDPGAVEMTWTQLQEDKLHLPPICREDMMQSLSSSKPSISEEELKKFEKFIEDFVAI